MLTQTILDSRESDDMHLSQHGLEFNANVQTLAGERAFDTKFF